MLLNQQQCCKYSVLFLLSTYKLIKGVSVFLSCYLRKFLEHNTSLINKFYKKYYIKYFHMLQIYLNLGIHCIKSETLTSETVYTQRNIFQLRESFSTYK